MHEHPRATPPGAPRTPTLRRPRAGTRRSGFSMIELLIAMMVMLVAVSMYASTVTSNVRQRIVNHERLVATQAARNMLETLRNQEFTRTWALFNGDPADDPAGEGTAPGQHFDVPGLQAAETDQDGCVGSIVFPALWDGPGSAWELREDVSDAVMGMPRDLNGDSVLDAKDHADDYLILPVRVEIAWEGRAGRREFVLHTMISEVPQK